MMKKWFYRALAAVVLSLALVSCGKSNKEENKKLDVSGIWMLTSVSTKSAQIGDVTVSVYIEFTSTGTFTLYQKLGEGRYSAFTGTYTIEKHVLSGNYSDKKAWGPYDATCEDETLTLTSANGEVDTYKKIGAIPSDVAGYLY